MTGRIGRRRALAAAGAGVAMIGRPAVARQLVKSGTVVIDQMEVAFIGNAAVGGGTLHFRGKSYRFSIGGLGIGGFGISKMEATGDVYDLHELSQFPGAYGAAHTGAAAGDKGGGELWLENAKGVTMSLKAKRQGLALTLGADAVVVTFK